MNMESRIKKIERVVRPKRCRECGGSLTATSKVEVRVNWRIYGEPEPPAEPQFCPACGRQLVFVLNWPEVSA